MEKLLRAGCFYPVPLTEWVSHLVPVEKKHVTIHVYVDYLDLKTTVQNILVANGELGYRQWMILYAYS